LGYSHYLGATVDTTELYTAKGSEKTSFNSQNSQTCAVGQSLIKNRKTFQITNLPSDDLSPYNVHKHLHYVQNKTGL
jgi:hypothetical protein